MSSDAAAGAGLYIVSAPSGAGKTSLLRALVERRPRLAFSVSYTTREPRSDEIEGRDYHFIAEREFERMRGKGEFLECACVYGNGYGTGAADVLALRAAGRDVVLEIDWQGAREVRSRVPESISVFILPPSRAVLRSRLTRRGTDSEQTITERMAVAAA
ncbi:MAG TPA: guanylate kinase, partial [Gammaproteobacteria bacterium]|nr:guanylate kinase [Gammaproteobacteria bacterium]